MNFFLTLLYVDIQPKIHFSLIETGPLEFSLWIVSYKLNDTYFNKHFIIYDFIELYDMNKNTSCVLRWDTYWNLPHLPDLTGSSPCPYRAGGVGRTWGAIHPSLHPQILPNLWTKPVPLNPPSIFSDLPSSRALFNLFRHHKMILTIALLQYSISIQENWTLLVYQTFTIGSDYLWIRILTFIL